MKTRQDVSLLKICPYLTHWAYWGQIFVNIENVPSCLATEYIGVRWLGTFKMYSACAHWIYLGHIKGYI